MLLSTVFHLKALERGSLPQYMGAAVRSQFMTWMGVTAEEDDPDEMHEGNKLRPYTVSDLKGTFRAQQGVNHVELGQNAWFRATTLRNKESFHLRDDVIPGLQGRVIQLGRVSFEVQKVAMAGEHPWADETSYERLARKYFCSPESLPNALKMEFVSLTTFHDGDRHMPLPLPETVLGSWLRRWNYFSSSSLPQTVDDLREAKLALSRYELKTHTVIYKQATWIGFTGSCRYRVLSGNAFWIALCNMLAEYSFYAGTGYKTTFGLGQTRSDA